MKTMHSPRCFFTFTCQLSEQIVRMFLNLKFLLPIYYKFGAECDGNNKISHIPTNYGFLTKKWFSKEKFGSFKFGKGGKFAVECASNDIMY